MKDYKTPLMVGSIAIFILAYAIHQFQIRQARKSMQQELGEIDITSAAAEEIPNLPEENQ